MPKCSLVLPPCCQGQIHSHASHGKVPLTKKLEIICAVSLAAFAFYHRFALFISSALIGASYQAIKIACNINQKKQETQRPACGQGFGELISQLSLLSPEIIFATSYVA